MSVLAFLAITFGAGAAGLLTRRRPTISISIGLLGLAAALVSALLVSPGDRLVVGESALVATDFMHLFIVFGSVAALALCVMALAADAWQRNLSSAMLLGLGALALGLALADPVAGLAATAAAGLPGVLVAITTPVDARGVRSAARELRAVAVTGALALVAAALVSGPSGLVNLPTTIVGLAYLAMALAVAVRIGAIPFHTRVARVTGSAPTAALPLLLALAPAGFASAALVWIDGNIATTAIPLEAERAVVIVVGLLCLLLGVLAATIQDDIEHVVGYSVIQDAGFVLLALAVFDPLVWEPARTWLLIYVVTKSAFAGWALAMRASFETSRIGELSGWIRRAPLLAIALGLIVAATVGIPGLLVFDVRSQIATLSLGSPLALLAIAGGLGSLLYYGRLARVGIGPVAPLVAAYPGVMPRGPGWAAAHVGPGISAAGTSTRGEVGTGGVPVGAMASGTATAGAAETAGDGATAAGSATGRVGRRSRRGAEPLPLALDAADAGGAAAAAHAEATARATLPDAALEGSAARGAADAPAGTGDADVDAPAGTAGWGAADAPPSVDDADVGPGAATDMSGGGAADGTDTLAGDAAAGDAADTLAGDAADAPAPAFLLRGPDRRAPTRQATGRTPGESPASERPPSVRGPRIDQLRRDPKELTQAWAREALERAGLAPPTTESGIPDDQRPPDGARPATGGEDAGETSTRRTPAPAPAPAREARVDAPPAGEAERPADGRPADGSPAAPMPAARRTRAPRTSSGPRRRSAAGALWAANRLLVIALLALVLSGLGLAAAAGAFGVSDAARAQAPSPDAEILGPGDQGGEPVGPGEEVGPEGSPAPGDSAEPPVPSDGSPAASTAVPGADEPSPAVSAAP